MAPGTLTINGGGGVQRDCAHYLHPVRTSYSSSTLYRPKRPKARGLAQHGSPLGWLEEIDPAGVILYRLPLPYSTGCPDRSCELTEFPAVII